ncbi:MAG TPA: hypothetical protein VGR73_23580 [Bryobacteraceae bacterium]|nr:hypothetical protein [Bryobacteraceae bacterium]
MRVLVCALLAISLATGQSLTTEQAAAAIERGKQYKTKDKFLEKGLRGVRVKLASALARGDTSIYVTFFNDWNYIAAEAAAANQQLKEVKPEDFHPEGLLHAFVEVHAIDSGAASRLNRRYLGDRAHLVIRAEDRTIQPVTKSMLKRSDDFNIGSVLFGGLSGKITLEFTFEVAPADLAQEVEVILVDGDGNQHKAKAKLAEALQLK